jgi:hypothetical protein
MLETNMFCASLFLVLLLLTNAILMVVKKKCPAFASLVCADPRLLFVGVVVVVVGVVVVVVFVVVGVVYC